MQLINLDKQSSPRECPTEGRGRMVVVVVVVVVKMSSSGSGSGGDIIFGLLGRGARVQGSCTARDGCSFQGTQSDGGQRIVNMAVGKREGKGRGGGLVEGIKGGRAVKDKGGQMIYMQNKSQSMSRRRRREAEEEKQQMRDEDQ